METRHFHPRLTLALFLSCSLVLLRGGIAGAQDTSTSGIPACESCRIEVLQTVTAGSPGDPEIFGDYTFGVVRLSDGRIYAPGATANVLMVFDQGGSFLHTLGQPGPGPEEFTMIVGLKRMPGDSLLVLQPGRFSVFSGTESFARSAPFRLNSAPALSVGPGGNLLYSRWLESPAGEQKQFHILDSSFDPIFSFGDVSPQEQELCGRCATRPAAWSTGKPDHFWSVRPNQYEIELYHKEGRRVRRIQVEGSPWFEPWTKERDGDRGATAFEGSRSTRWGERPIPYFSSIHEDADGLLWLSAVVPASDWKPFRGDVPSMMGVNDVPPELQEYLKTATETVIEVVDPDAAQVLASIRTGRVLSLLDGQTYRTFDQDESGFIRLQLFEAHLRGRH